MSNKAVAMRNKAVAMRNKAVAMRNKAVAMRSEAVAMASETASCAILPARIRGARRQHRRSRHPTHMTSPRLLPLSALILLAACGGAAPKPVESASGAAPPAAAPSAAPSAEASAEAAPAPGGRDPAIAALAKAALGCKFEDDAFDAECPAFKAWDSEEALFADDHGDDTLFSMLGDPDVKVQALATHKDITHPYWEDKGHAEALFALGKAAKSERVAGHLGGYAAMVNAEELGLGAALKDVARHAASPAFRKALAFHLNSYVQTKTVAEADEILIADPDPEVADAAVEALTRGGDTSEPVCKLLVKQLTRSDALHATALWGGASTSCAGVKEQVAVELAKRIADPRKLTQTVGREYAYAASGLCRAGSPALKKKGLEDRPAAHRRQDPRRPRARRGARRRGRVRRQGRRGARHHAPQGQGHGEPREEHAGDDPEAREEVSRGRDPARPSTVAPVRGAWRARARRPLPHAVDADALTRPLTPLPRTLHNPAHPPCEGRR